MLKLKLKPVGNFLYFLIAFWVDVFRMGALLVGCIAGITMIYLFIQLLWRTLS